MLPSDLYVKAGPYRAQILAAPGIDAQMGLLLVDLLVPSTAAPVGSIEVFPNRSGTFVLRSDGRVWADAVQHANVGDAMIRMLLLAALDAEPSLVHIHAGAVVKGDDTAIIAGIPGSGKSTAIVTLSSSGFSYVTDERLVVSPDGRRVAGFPKPISLIGGSRTAFAHLDPQRTGIGSTSSEAWQIPASSLGSCSPQAFRTPSILVFIAYRENARLRTLTVTPLDAAARLLIDSPDVITRGHDGADSIVSLASSTPSVQIEYSKAEELVATVRALLDNPPKIGQADPLVLKGDTPLARPTPALPGGLDPSKSFAIVDDVSVWIIDDCALAYMHGTGRIVELDATYALWLQLLDGLQSVDELVEEAAVATDNDVDAIRAAALQVVQWLWSSRIIGPTEAAR